MPMRPRRAFFVRQAALVLAAAGFIGAGTLHFAKAEAFRRIVPPGWPGPGVLVAASGVAEIVGGAGLLVRPVRRAAGWGLIALLIAVFPANVHMAVRAGAFADVAPPWVLWARLPLQGVLIAWVAWASRFPARPPALADAANA